MPKFVTKKVTELKQGDIVEVLGEELKVHSIKNSKDITPSGFQYTTTILFVGGDTWTLASSKSVDVVYIKPQPKPYYHLSDVMFYIITAIIGTSMVWSTYIYKNFGTLPGIIN